MVACMPLKPGSKAPQKLRSKIVLSIVALLKQASDDELLIVRKLLLAMFAERDLAAVGGSSLYPTSPRNRCVMALDRADLKCRAKTGGKRGLRTIPEYQEVMKDEPGAPTASTIARVLGGGCWPQALVVAGIGGERYLEPLLVRGSGSRTRQGAREAWTDEERDEAMAYAIEANHGYDISKEGYEYYRDFAPRDTPTYPTLLGKRYKGGKLVGGVTLAVMHERAKKLILRQPEPFSLAAARLALVADVRAAEAAADRKASKPSRRTAPRPVKRAKR